LNSVVFLILRYFTEFDSFAGRLRHSGWRLYAIYAVCYNVRIISSISYTWPKTYPFSSRTLSLRQRSFLFVYVD